MRLTLSCLLLLVSIVVSSKPISNNVISQIIFDYYHPKESFYFWTNKKNAIQSISTQTGLVNWTQIIQYPSISMNRLIHYENKLLILSTNGIKLSHIDTETTASTIINIDKTLNIYNINKFDIHGLFESDFCVNINTDNAYSILPGNTLNEEDRLVIMQDRFNAITTDPMKFTNGSMNRKYRMIFFEQTIYILLFSDTYYRVHKNILKLILLNIFNLIINA
eukprot:198891_1